MSQIKIIALFPLSVNGGITSWAKKFLRTFPDSNYQLIPINSGPSKHYPNRSHLLKIIFSLIDLPRIGRDVRCSIIENKPHILHTTTSGNIGSFRDYIVGRICRKYNVKTVLHCHYGCIPDDLKSKGLVGMLLKMALRQFDQVWVLDRSSYNALKAIPKYAKKVYLTPNSIAVNAPLDDSGKKYDRIAFIGNLIPTKGIYELVEAATKSHVRLDIIGPGAQTVIDRIKLIAGDKLSQTIFIHGRLANDDAVQFMKQTDMIALPTYFRSEAFPMSILEAMSLSKLVISCKRAAIPDMLTALDGSCCGILVDARSTDAIVDAINWCQQNRKQADDMRIKAYEKVYKEYRTEVVYEIYRENYKKLIQ